MDSHIEELIGMLGNDDGQAQLAVAELAGIGIDAVEPLIGVLSGYKTYDDYSLDSQRHHWAEETLVEIGQPAVVPLIHALQDEAWGAHAGAAYVLGKIGDVRVVQPLIEAMRFEEMQGGETHEALLGFGDIALRPLLYALKNHENAVVRCGAAATLGDISDPLVIPALIKALEADDDENVRQTAAYLLGKQQDARAVEPLIAALGDPSPMLREASVRALGEIGAAVGGARIREALALALHDADWGTRQSAAEMLIKLGGGWQESAEALLIKDLQNSDVEIRLGAAWSLVELHDERALDPLLRLLYHHESRIASAAAFGLGELGDQRAVVPLTAVLDHADETVREAASAGLRRLGHSD